MDGLTYDNSKKEEREEEEEEKRVAKASGSING